MKPAEQQQAFIIRQYFAVRGPQQNGAQFRSGFLDSQCAHSDGEIRQLPFRRDDMKCPAELYTASARTYAGLPVLSYPFHDRDVMVTACGRLCLHRKRINISTVLAGQKLGIKEVDEGIWLVSFMHYDLGYFDLEQKTLQPLDNPFGSRLLPMS